MRKILKALIFMLLLIFCTFPSYAKDSLQSITPFDENNLEVYVYKGLKVEENGDLREFIQVYDVSVIKSTKVVNVEPYFETNKIEKSMYVSAENGLNFRKFPNTTYDTVYKTLPYGTKVKVIGVSKNGWAIVDLDNKEVFCWSKFLSDKKPVKKIGSYLGTYQLTAYCGCSKCCGKSNGITASGTRVTQGRTVACNSLPFGTKVSINGHIYTVEDRGGMGRNVIDIYFNSHSEALAFGRQSAKIYKIN